MSIMIAIIHSVYIMVALHSCDLDSPRHRLGLPTQIFDASFTVAIPSLPAPTLGWPACLQTMLPNQ
jgi:hypothetical protein